jgi:alanine-glyoxylate transaminase/serine-glyoxylate transaminase/serine-pyruvate transaminase
MSQEKSLSAFESLPRRLLLGPGPSMVHSRVYEALGRPLVGHLDPLFLELMTETQQRLRQVFLTDNQLTIAVSGTGSAGMEAALVNLVEPSDEVLVCVNGVFGNRMSDIVGRIGGSLHRIDRPWGEVFESQEVADALERWPRTRLVAIVHAETSTGACQPLVDIGRICRQRDCLLLVDAVTSLAGVELRVDDWWIDACYAGTQKCLSCPPGLAPLTVGPRAVAKLQRRKSKVVSWYLDLTMIQQYWTERQRTYHHTAPISMNYALHEALALVLEEKLEPRWERHRLHSRALMAGLQAFGFEPAAQEGHRLPVLNAVRVPQGIDESRLRRQLLEDFDIEIGGGLGDLAGRVWRIGLMGESARRDNVHALVLALVELLTPNLGAAKANAALDAVRAAYVS